MSELRYVMLLNARAGLLRWKAAPRQIEQMARMIGLDIEVIPTASAEEMCNRIRKLVLQGTERLVVAGGDGTISLAVQELAHSDTILGIIPQGTHNNFATSLRLPQDLPSALRVLRDGAVREVSLGKVGDRYFTEAAGVGLFADILSLYGVGTNKNLIRAIHSMARVIVGLRAHRLRITLDGNTVIERAVMCTISNSYRMASGLPIAPDARLTDDVFDVTVLSDLKRSDLVPYYRAIRAQLHPSLPKVSFYRAKTITIDSNRPLNVHCDDRAINTTPVTMTIHPRALRVMVDCL